MKNLGVKESEKYGWCSPEATIAKGKKKKERVYFPSSEFCGTQVDAAGLAKAKAGDRFKMTIEVVVRRANESTREDDTIRKEVGFDIVSTTDAEAIGDADENDDGKDDASVEARGKKTAKADEDDSPKPAAEDDREQDTVSPEDAGLDD